MNLTELSARVKALTGNSDTAEVLSVAMKVIQDTLVAGDKVVLSGIGTLIPVESKRTGYDFKHGTQYESTVRRVKFNPSDKLKMAVSARRNDII